MTTPRYDDSQLHDGMHYPIGHLIGVLRTPDDAEQTAQSLYAAGYTDVEILEGPGGREILVSTEHAASPLARAWDRLSVYLSEESDDRQAALDALSRGHAIVMVYASGKAQEHQAESILLAHGARELAYFGRWSVTRLTH